MIETIFPHAGQLPFYYKQKGSILISDCSSVLDLFFLEEINALVLQDYDCFNDKPHYSYKNYVEILDDLDMKKLADFNFKKSFIGLIKDLLDGMSSSIIGVQLTEPQRDMCSNFHIDKLSLRLVQCLDGEGTTLVSSNGDIIKTEKNDLVFLKGEMWESAHGAIMHKAPDSPAPRTLFRIDFLD